MFQWSLINVKSTAVYFINVIFQNIINVYKKISIHPAMKSVKRMVRIEGIV